MPLDARTRLYVDANLASAYALAAFARLLEKGLTFDPAAAFARRTLG